MTFAFVGTVSAVENWILSETTPYVLTFTCTSGCGGVYPHTLDLTLYDVNDGSFTGVGRYNVTPTITWSVTNGNISGNNISFKVDYDASLYYVDVVGTIATSGAMSGTAGNLSQTFTWTMTPNALYNRRAEILNPTEGEKVEGLVSFTAYLNDDDADNIQWAVRQGTCDMVASANVFGNVTGVSDIADIDQDDLSNQTFSFTGNMSGLDEGNYCFVYNPVEDSGESNLRLTREFVLDHDFDDDGVLNEIDKCPGTGPDTYEAGLGTNRWMWNGEGWVTNSPAEKNGKAVGPNVGFTIADTFGCSCTQILDSMSKTLGEDFQGHYNFMCSKSIIEDWISGEYYLETVNVPSTTGVGIDSVMSPILGQDYFLKASGTYRFGSVESWGEYGIADAEYAYRNDSYSRPLPPDNWTLGDDTNYPSVLGLDVQVDNVNVYWGNYSTEHKYTYLYSGTDNPIHFHIYDNQYTDNSGEIAVDIFAKLW